MQGFPHRWQPANAVPGSGPGTVTAAVRVGQIITFALAQGVILIAAVMVYLAMDGDRQPHDRRQDGGEAAAATEESTGLQSADLLLPAIGLLTAAAACLAAVFVPGSLRHAAIDRFIASGEPVPMSLDPTMSLSLPLRELVQAKMTATLVSQALLEGAAVTNAILLMVSREFLLLVPLAVCVFGIVVQVPTIAKLLDWLQSVRRG